MIKQEREEDILEKDNEIEEENPYQITMINNFEKNNVDRSISQVEKWSILSNVINYGLHNRNPRDNFNP